MSDAQSIADAVQALGLSATGDRDPLLVVDQEGRLAGRLDERLALLRGLGGSVRECLEPVRALPAGAHLSAAVVEFALSNERCLPIVDGRSRPIGLLHRSRLPDVSTAPDADAPPMLAALVATMLELLVELPTLAAAERRVP